ncbi:hypothetical protein H7H51_30785 [Mycolicibacterium farcinogenes]|nr:hypothetical protein [Mycolicibacterium farcinogenes]
MRTGTGSPVAGYSSATPRARATTVAATPPGHAANADAVVYAPPLAAGCRPLAGPAAVVEL